MAGNHTNNYHLNQWEPEDKVLRTEFNEDNLKIDEALAGLRTDQRALAELVDRLTLRLVTGSYVGTGKSETIHYSIGAAPKLLVVTTNNEYDYHTCTGLWAMGDVAFVNYTDQYVKLMPNYVAFDEDGFSINHSLLDLRSGLNRDGSRQTYRVLC